MKISLVAALDRNGLIGKKGTLPWESIPRDMRRFVMLTRGKPVVMGRKTLEAIVFQNGGPLEGRANIVLSRRKAFSAKGCTVVCSRDEALEAARKMRENATSLCVIGGREIYELFLPLAEVLYLTEIDAAFSGDTYFPITDFRDWQVVQGEYYRPGPGNAWPLAFKELRRMNIEKISR